MVAPRAPILHRSPDLDLVDSIGEMDDTMCGKEYIIDNERVIDNNSRSPQSVQIKKPCVSSPRCPKSGSGYL